MRIINMFQVELRIVYFALARQFRNLDLIINNKPLLLSGLASQYQFWLELLNQAPASNKCSFGLCLQRKVLLEPAISWPPKQQVYKTKQKQLKIHTNLTRYSRLL